MSAKPKVFSSTNSFHCVFQVLEEKLKKSWVTVDAQTNQREDVKRETVYCLDDDNETEVQVEDTIQGHKMFLNSDCFIGVVLTTF